MKLYFAAAVGTNKGTNGGEKLVHATGATNRLVSFANTGASSVQARKFWIENRSEALKLYVAGNGKSNGSSQRDHDNGLRNRLLSYAFIDNWAKQEFEYWIDNSPQEASVLLDSGAFSAWRLGTPIDLGKYCEYLEEHKHALDAYIVLDAIRQPWQATQANLDIMRKRGLDPLPVYHSDVEPLHVWERILSENTGYVCLGGLAVERPNKADLNDRLKRCWKLVEKHWPVKVHGLGVTTQWMIERFPFYSVDSASAIMGAGMGNVQRWEGGRLFARNWQEDAAVARDGAVIDGVGRKKAEGKRSSESAHEGRRMRNIQAQLQLERYVTDLWAARGVTWQK